MMNSMLMIKNPKDKINKMIKWFQNKLKTLINEIKLKNHPNHNTLLKQLKAENLNN